MAEKISDLSGDEREKRIAELKRRMQESAKRNRASQGDTESEASEAPSADSSAQAAAREASTQSETSVAEAEAEPEAEETPSTDAATETSKPSTPVVSRAVPAKPSANGSSPKPSPEPEGPTDAEMNRREFLTYAWGAALGLLALEGGVMAFQFMYPRFKAGEFGGVFTVGPESALPEPTADPQPNPAGKFWLVTTETDEPKALYMVCTHLGCLYQWVESNYRFECPCHGSKFTHDGFYIEGPAPRSLDYFDTEVVDGTVVVDTGSRNLGSPSSESPANANAA